MYNLFTFRDGNEQRHLLHMAKYYQYAARKLHSDLILLCQQHFYHILTFSAHAIVSLISE